MPFKSYVIEENLGNINTDTTFKEHTTIGTGGNIKYFYSPNSISSLCKAFKYINDNKLKYFIIGNGSNVLAKDSFYDGIVIDMKSINPYLKIYDDFIEVSASYSSTKLAFDLAKLSLGDLSFLGGIPGLIGGAIYNNAGAFNREIQDVIIEVNYINSLGNIITISKDYLKLKYRYSLFHELNGIIISAKFRIEKIETKTKLKEQLIIRKNKQPLDYKNMGSIFKNNKDIEAWKVVDRLDMRGFSINGAKVSNKHTNFIINYENATSADILALINLIKKRAKSELGINLDTEIIII